MIKSDIRKIFKDSFNKYPKKLKFNDYSIDNVEDWDSIAHVNFLLKIEKEYKIKFSTKEFFQLNSIKKIKKKLSK